MQPGKVQTYCWVGRWTGWEGEGWFGSWPAGLREAYATEASCGEGACVVLWWKVAGWSKLVVEPGVFICVLEPLELGWVRLRLWNCVGPGMPLCRGSLRADDVYDMTDGEPELVEWLGAEGVRCDCMDCIGTDVGRSWPCSTEMRREVDASMVASLCGEAVDIEPLMDDRAEFEVSLLVIWRSLDSMRFLIPGRFCFCSVGEGPMLGVSTEPSISVESLGSCGGAGSTLGSAGEAAVIRWSAMLCMEVSCFFRERRPWAALNCFSFCSEGPTA